MNEKIKNRISKSLLIFFLLISYIYADDDCSSCDVTNNSCEESDGSTCPEACKIKLYGTTKRCYNCGTNVNNDLYYKITNSECQYISTCNGKKVYETNECVDSCENGSLEIVDYCYPLCPSYSTHPDNTNKCECSYKYY